MHEHEISKPRMLRVISIAALLVLAPVHAFAHGSGGADNKVHDTHAKSMQHTSAQEHAFGKASDPAAAARTIEVTMHDTMRFAPETIEVEAGKPLRFIVRNDGKLLHEMVLGTRDALEQHAAMMKKFPGMEHAEPYMAHVDPGARGEIGWTFTQPGEYFYGCLVPGHFEAGMVGRIVVR
jgi:uncharacterized cupredoxin-like copper-binding protein